MSYWKIVKKIKHPDLSRFKIYKTSAHTESNHFKSIRSVDSTRVEMERLCQLLPEYLGFEKDY